MLDSQIHIYSIDTGNFYSAREEQLHIKNHKLRVERNQLINGAEIKLFGKSKRKIIGCKEIEVKLKKYGLNDNDIKSVESNDCDYTEILLRCPIDKQNEVLQLCYLYKKKKDLIKYKLTLIRQSKEELLNVLKRKVELNLQYSGQHHKRYLVDNKVSKKEIISVFESVLTRTIGIEPNTLSDEIMVVQVYYFDILKDIINNGFWYNDCKYIFLTASAGQIRTKKVVFIKESTWLKIEKTIMCGLSVQDINDKGGINSNKFVAYTALSNSATDKWVNFDIDKTIVIDDFETNVYGEYDFVDEKDFSITRKKDYVPIPHSDGCGIGLPDAFGEKQVNKMVRLPWVKGLIAVFDFRKFIKVNNCSPIIKDIYGQEHDIIAEDIQVIFTKSQFKLNHYYSSWDNYKENFKKYHCQASFTNPEEDRIKNATINYQMLQSLTDITDEEIQNIAQKSIDSLTDMCSSVDTVKRILGITPYMKPERMSYLQQAIQIYPELLNDNFIRTKLKDIKDSLITKYKAGKLKVNGKYTFLLPDLYAACEFWFMGNKDPKGLLEDGEIYCNLFRNSQEIDCLRSPHLFMEHSIRQNVAFIGCEKQKQISEWFITKAAYTSCHDLITKIIQADFDGDKGLIVSDKTLIDVAKRNIKKYDIVPLYYNMAKAGAVQISNNAIYNNLVLAFTGGNIGQFSNNISKIWNNDVFQYGSEDEKIYAINCIKRLCCMNNFVIDQAKTLYVPKYPDNVKIDIKEFTKLKLPYFFIYAKDKNDSQVESVNNSFVNKINNIIPNPRISHKYIDTKGKTRKLGKPDHTLLMTDIFCYVDKENNSVVNKYSEIIKQYGNALKNISVDNVPKENWSNATMKKYLKYQQIICDIKNEFSKTGYSDMEIADILVVYLYENDNPHKSLLWNCYGEILLGNLKQWVKRKTRDVQCPICGEWFEIDIKERFHKCKNCKKMPLI